MRPLKTTLITTAALAAAVAPAASADTLVADAPGARNLVAGGGHLAWSAPSADGWRLTVRAPDGTVSQPAIAPFARPPQAVIGTTDQFGATRRLVAIYTRDGDVYELDLRTGTEAKNTRLSTGATETLAAVNLGQYVVARRGRGLYRVSRSGSSRRLTRTVPSAISMAPSRVASIEGTGSGRKVVIRRLSGRGRPMVAGRGVVRPNSLWLTRYRAGWATSNPQVGSRLSATRRFAGSGGPYTLSVRRGTWTSPSALYGIAVERGEPSLYLDDEGIKRFAPVPFHGGGR